MRKSVNKFIIAALLLLLIPVFSALAAEEEEQGIVSYEDVTEVEDVFVQYHNSLNDFFNEKMDRLMETDDANAIIKQNEVPPDRDFRKCLPNYTSTWCVAMNMTNEYYRMREKAIAALQSYENKVTAKQPKDFAALINEKADLVKRELSIAQQTLERSVAAYDELRVAWALHVKYLKLIDELEDFRNAIAKIRDEVDLFPVTFFNVQTTQCT